VTSRTFHIVQAISRPVADVWARYVDPEAMRVWMELRAVKDLDGPLDRAGTHFVQVVFGPYRFHSEVLRSEPPTFHELSGRGPFGTSYRWTTRFNERDGGTEMTTDLEARASGRITGWMLRFWARSEDHPPADIRRSFAKFARLVESS
jgi:uncharacterized protein YndB with AHSA1/START domain